MAKMWCDLMLSQPKLWQQPKGKEGHRERQDKGREIKQPRDLGQRRTTSRFKKTSRLSTERSRGQKNGELENGEMIF